MRMRNSLSIVVLSLLLVVGVSATRSTPELRYTSAPGVAEPFSVSFQPGAVYACLRFSSQVETIVQDGKTVRYEPRKCYLLDEQVHGFEESWAFIEPNGGKWDIQVEVWYPDSPSESPDESNILTLVH